MVCKGAGLGKHLDSGDMGDNQGRHRLVVITSRGDGCGPDKRSIVSASVLRGILENRHRELQTAATSLECLRVTYRARGYT